MKTSHQNDINTVLSVINGTRVKAPRSNMKRFNPRMILSLYHIWYQAQERVLILLADKQQKYKCTSCEEWGKIYSWKYIHVMKQQASLWILIFSFKPCCKWNNSNFDMYIWIIMTSLMKFYHIWPYIINKYSLLTFCTSDLTVEDKDCWKHPDVSFFGFISQKSTKLWKRNI